MVSLGRYAQGCGPTPKACVLHKVLLIVSDFTITEFFKKRGLQTKFVLQGEVPAMVVLAIRSIWHIVIFLFKFGGTVWKV